MADDAKTSILIVDDLPEKILAYRSVLEELDQNLVTAGSGAEALKQVLKTDFAVILLDVNMPDMDGFETARLIRQRRLSSHIPIIFLTAFADEVRTAEGYATGGVDYLPTPVVPEILRAKVRVFVELYQMRQQVAQKAEEQAMRAAAEQSARRSEFLAEASRAFASSLDVETTLRGVPRVAVPFLADVSIACLLDAEGRPAPIELVWMDADATAPQIPARGSFQPSGRLAAAIARAGTNRQTERLERLADTAGNDLMPTGSDDHPLPPSLSEAIVLPLAARGMTLGVLVLARSTSGRRFDVNDVVLAEDLAARAEIAIDNALLVRNIQENDSRKDEFLAMLAHELRNPLAPIRTGLDVLASTGSDEAVITPMRRQVEHLVRLVDDLLDVSRITRGTIDLRLQRVDMKSVVANAVETSLAVSENKKHEWKVITAEQSLPVMGDPVRLAQIVLNLLNNAAKYTPEGGDISVTTDLEGDDVVVRVRDSGAGIPQDMLPKVFDLFVQVGESIDRSRGGLGIGLTLVRRLVEMHHGSVEAHSHGPGHGSEFVVRIPQAEARVDTPASVDPATPARSEAAPCRILVVDDNVDAATTLGMLLRLRGHEVQLAHDGLTALDAARTYAPNVVLLDIGLPGLDGYGVARRLRQHPETESTLLIAVSGYGQEEDRRRSREAGFDQHLTKPVDFKELSGLLAGSLSQVAAG